MLFYFTATGNSPYVAKLLDKDRISIAQAIHDETKVYRADRIGIVCPMMAIQMRMPEKNLKARYRNKNISICEIVDANNQNKEEETESHE